MDIQSIDNIHVYWKQVFHVLKRASKPVLQELGLTKVDANILLVLYQQRESTKTELAERLCFDANCLTRSLDRLVEMKAVNRITAKEDNRFIKLSLTSTGNIIAKNYIDGLRSTWMRLLECYSPQEIKALEALLLKLVHNLGAA